MFEFANQTNIESDHDRPDGLWISGFALRSPCGLTSAEAAEIEHCYTTPWDAIDFRAFLDEHVPSYHASAKALDKFRRGPAYYSLRIELFARIVETYCFNGPIRKGREPTAIKWVVGALPNVYPAGREYREAAKLVTKLLRQAR